MMRREISIFLLLALVWLFQAPNSQSQEGRATQGPGVTIATSTNSILPLPSSRSLSATQLAGKILFVQRCSVCHLPGLAIFDTYGPLLDSRLVTSQVEATAREIIMKGSRRMPGFQYALEPKEIDNILAYLKTLEYDAAGKKYKYIESSAKQ